MIVFKKITASNFMSFGQKPIEFVLDNDVSTLILGRNEDIGEKGNSRNGVGKTTLFNAIIFALYGKGIDKLKADEYINIVNEKKLLVTLEFTKGSDEYVITRGRKPNLLSFTKNGVDLTLDAMKNTDQEIIDVIGVEYDIFMSIFFLSPHKDSFMAMSTGDQRAFIESVLTLNKLSERAETLKSMKKDFEVDLKLVDKEKTTVESNNEQITKNIERLTEKSEKFEIDKKSAIDELKTAIADLSDIDFDRAFELLDSRLAKKEEVKELENIKKDLDFLIQTTRTEISNVEKKINNFKDLVSREKSYLVPHEEKKTKIELSLTSFKEKSFYEDQYKMIEELTRKQQELKTKKQSLVSSKENFSILEKQFSSKCEHAEKLSNGTCPTCEQVFVDQAKIDSVIAEIEKDQEIVSQLENKIIKLEDEIVSLNSDIEDISSKITEDNPRAKLNEIDSLTRELEKIQEIISSGNPITSMIESSVSKKEDDVSLLSVIEDLTDKLSSATKDREDTQNLINTGLKTIQSLTSEIVSVFGFDGERKEFEEMRWAKSDLVQALQTKEAEINPYPEEIEHTKSLFRSTEEIDNNKKSIENEIVHIGYLVKLLTDPKSFVRKNIVDMYIPFVNKKINEYTEELGLSHMAIINPDLSVDITYMNRSVSYYMMSQGERLRLNLATAMAFRELVALLGNNNNLLLMDEIFDSALDAEGIVRAFKFVRNKAKHTIMISHKEEFIPMVDEITTIVKKNGFASVE